MMLFGYRTRRAMSALAACGMLLVACTDSPSSDEQLAGRRFSLGLIPGAQGFVDFVMEEQGIFEQFDLRPEKLQSLNPPTLHLMIAEKQVDIGFAGFTTMATARSQGRDTIVIYGIFSPVNAVFVPHDSDLRELDDLRGKRLGTFGGPGSTTFAFLSVIAQNWYGLDMFNDVELVTAPGPALIELLERGDLDAVLLGTIESIEMQAQERFRVLTDLSEEYRELQGGRAPAHVTIATNEEFATENPGIVRDYLEAYRTALRLRSRESRCLGGVRRQHRDGESRVARDAERKDRCESDRHLGCGTDCGSERLSESGQPDHRRKCAGSRAGRPDSR